MASSKALDALGHAISGSVGTAISTATLYPLDLVTTRLKAQNQRRGGDGDGDGEQKADGHEAARYSGVVEALQDIVSREGGIGALYHGLGVDLGKSVVDSFLFFGFYNYLRRRGRQPGTLEELAVGAAAGACARALTTPISNVVTRKQTAPAGEQATLGEMLATMRRESGLAGLWSGYSATLVLTLNPSITFLVNRRLAARIIPALEDEDVPVAWIAFLIAAFSKAVATAVTYPFQTGKTRLQVAGRSTGNKVPGEDGEKKRSTSVLRRVADLLDRSIFGVILRIIKEEGVRALYAGIQGELLKSFFSHGLTMLNKGVIHRLVIRLWLLSLPHLQRRRLQAKLLTK